MDKRNSDNPQMCVIASLLSAFATGSSANAETIYVDALCGHDSWTGTNPVCQDPDGPKATIQAAIDAVVDGDEVVVADGIYTGDGNRDIDFGGKLITVRSSTGPEKCIIDCEGTNCEESHRGVYFHNGETTAAVFEGFTIRNGYVGNSGGGMLIEEASPTVTNCIFTDNWAIHYCASGPKRGGAVAVLQGAPVFTDCLFLDNYARGYCHNDSLGGGLFSSGHPTLIRCVFRENIALSSCEPAPPPGFGGGMYIAEGSAVLNDCAFEYNDAGISGGGIYIAEGSVVLNACTFAENTATVRGGGLRHVNGTLSMTNCSFVGNHTASGGRGAGLFTSALSSLINCTFRANFAFNDAGGMFVSFDGEATLANCILWGDSPNEIGGEGSATVTYSNVQGGWEGEGNIDENPLFVDPDGPDDDPDTIDDNDYRLASGSPCIDAADNAAVPKGITTDLDENPRFIEDPNTPDTGLGDCPIVDMGAYEFQDGSQECELAIVSSDPPAEAIDARQPSDPDGENAAGWSAITLTFNGDASEAMVGDFSVATDPPGGVVEIADVSTDGSEVVLTFATIIPVEAWTIVTHIPGGSSVRIGSLPADVNNDKLSQANDVLFLIDVLNGVIDPTPPAYQTDTDRSGATNASDVLRVIDLLNGAGVYDVFNGASLPD